MTDAADVLDVRLAAPPGTDGPAADTLSADISSEVPADAPSQSPQFPESRQLLRDLVLRALL
jgi:hypothetical protein